MGTPGTDPREHALRTKLSRGVFSPCHAHQPPEVLAVHAAGELAAAEAEEVDRHLLACADGRCLAHLREALGEIAATRDALYGRREEASDPAFSPSLALPPVPRATAHTFQVDAALLETFEALARDEGCSTDQLLNEAMRALVQHRQRLARDPAPSQPALRAPRDVTFREATPTPFPRERNTPTLQRSYLPRAPASSRRSPVPPPVTLASGLVGGPRKLAVVVEGVLHEVDKDRYVVGRGGRGSDLAIDDPGVSRQHALIEHAGEEYWLVDMGSTNGIEYQGERIARHRIAHGDRFRIGDHELEFLLH